MRDPAQYEAAIRYLEKEIEALRRLIPVYAPHKDSRVVEEMRADLSALDAYRTAVRATLLASLIEKVEGMKQGIPMDLPLPPGFRESDRALFWPETVAHNALCDRFLTLLRTEAENG